MCTFTSYEKSNPVVMKLKGIAVAITLSTMLACASDACEDNDQFVADSDELVARSQAFFFEPTTANCEAYRAALSDYVDTYDGCDEVNQQVVVDARQLLDDLTCG